MKQNLRVRLTERDPKTGMYVKHNVMKFGELRIEILRANRSYFFTPLVGYWRRKTLGLIIKTLKRMST